MRFEDSRSAHETSVRNDAFAAANAGAGWRDVHVFRVHGSVVRAALMSHLRPPGQSFHRRSDACEETCVCRYVKDPLSGEIALFLIGRAEEPFSGCWAKRGSRALGSEWQA